MRERLNNTKQRRPVSWCSMGYNVSQLRPEIKKRFPSNLKLHYTEMVGVAERLSRRLKFKSQRTYDVQKHQRRSLGFFDQPSDSWVTVHNLRQLDGGILDPDDRLQDVADDREQIIAIYDEATQPQQGDGTSASDDSENCSPDFLKNAEHKFEPFSRNGIDITGEELNGTPPPLHVRRGSEPALNRLSPIPPYNNQAPLDPCKRWSAAPAVEEQLPPSSTPLKDQCDESRTSFDQSMLEGTTRVFCPPVGERGEGSGEEKVPSSSSASSSASSHHSATTTTLTRFSRDANRCSVQILSDNPGMARWAEAADRVIESTGFYGRSEGLRREPLGGAASPTHSREPSIEDRCRGDSIINVVLPNDGSPLGIHVIPSTDKSGLDQGLLVEGIESDGRVARDGSIKVHDVIIEINNKSLRNVTFHQAQEIFKDAMRDSELRLVVALQREAHINKLVQMHEKLSGGSRGASNRKVPPPPSLSSRTQTVILQSNTRKIGKRLSVNLVKGSHGLGFSITTRDNPAGGEAPIYIKNILPMGAAIEDGNLKIGDRLLEVNEMAVTGLSQPEVAGLLRQIPVGGMASLAVSRQEKIDSQQHRGIDGAEDTATLECPSPTLPRQLPSEKVPEDSLMFPWKSREILTFEIPVHDSERAGLGVSVKGKTSSSPNGNIDLGIFVKNVIHGGAASRDGRLRMNDQLVNINGLSLLGKSNSEAMETLRTAMLQEYRLRLLQSGSDTQMMDLPQEVPDPTNQLQQFVGPTPGMITLTVARRVDGSKSGRESVNSLSSKSLSGNHDYSGTSDVSDNTVICNFRKDRDFDRNVDNTMDVETFSANPVIQRLTGNNSNPSLRNESYYKATHDTWNGSQMQAGEKERMHPMNQLGSPTINPPSRDTVLIHDEYQAPPGAHRRSSTQSVGYSEQQSQSSDAYVSQSSLEEGMGGFSRDQFGRQSMSEKRHATLDAKSTDTYQRTKKAKEEREKYRQEMMAEMEMNGIHRPKNKDVVGPGLGMRKSSSLESLQTMVQEMTLEEECPRAGSGRVPRGRGCNESFRAAVDRSYDAPLASNNQMETLAEEESESSGSGFGRGNSRQSSLTSSVEERNKKLNKKKQGIFKGLGSMFRFGKHRKSLDNPIPNLTEEQMMDVDGPSSSRRHNLNASIHDPYRKNDENNPPIGDQNLSNISGVTLLDDDSGAQSRSERMHQLRAEHQRRHAQRKGMYPTDHNEEKYDQVISQRMEPSPAEPKAEIEHIRSRSYDMYGDNRPGSRGGIVDPHKFSHYVNYEQIQQHIRKNKEQERLAKLASQQYQDFREKQTSREQREYQSQRTARENSYQQQRPVSNYFEYESVQAMMSHAQDSSNTASLPRRHQQPHNRPAYPSPPQQNRNSHSPSKGLPKTSSRVMHPQQFAPPHREGHYAASGFRPASQYNAMHHSSNLVPGSKV